MSTYGFGHQVSAGNRIADEFTVTGATGWIIDEIAFYAYQTGSSPDPSTLTAVNYQIWDGPPNDPASTVVFGDTTTNRLLSSVWSSIYRVLDTGLLDTSRPIMANTVSAGVYLPPGIYWLDWQTDGSLASGPWAPPIAILGQTTTGNALQFTPSTGAWNPLVDSGTGTPQGFPFVLMGTPSRFRGTVGTEITITGSGYGTQKGRVLIGTTNTKIAKTAWTDTAITATVKKAPLPDIYDLTIMVKPYKTAPPIVLGAGFTVMNPDLDPLAVDHGAPGTEVTVTGRFFGTKRGKVYLEDGGSGKIKKCKVMDWSMDPTSGDSTLTFMVPSLPSGLVPGPYTLNVINKVGAAVTTFTVDP
jgi:hypothetical protein